MVKTSVARSTLILGTSGGEVNPAQPRPCSVSILLLVNADGLAAVLGSCSLYCIGTYSAREQELGPFPTSRHQMKFNPRTEYHQPLKAVEGPHEERWRCYWWKTMSTAIFVLLSCHAVLLHAGWVCWGAAFWAEHMWLMCPSVGVGARSQVPQGGVLGSKKIEMNKTWEVDGDTKSSGGWCELVSWHWIQGHCDCIGLGFAPRTCFV